MKRIRKQIKQTFDNIPHKSKAETLDALGITCRHKTRPAIGRRVALVAVCMIALCALGTSFVLAFDDPSIIGRLFEIIDKTGSSEVSEEVSAPTVSDPPFGVLLSSSSWKDELPEPVTGSFDTLSQAMQAVETEYEFYYPTWDGGFVELYGKDRSLLISVNAHGYVTPPNYGHTDYYTALQFNYHTKEIDHFMVVLGHGEAVPLQYDETYSFEGGTFYLYEPPYEGYEGKVLAVGTARQCGYTILADSAEAAKRMIDSLTMA